VGHSQNTRRKKKKKARGLAESGQFKNPTGKNQNGVGQGQTHVRKRGYDDDNSQELGGIRVRSKKKSVLGGSLLL